MLSLLALGALFVASIYDTRLNNELQAAPAWAPFGVGPRATMTAGALVALVGGLLDSLVRWHERRRVHEAAAMIDHYGPAIASRRRQINETDRLLNRALVSSINTTSPPHCRQLHFGRSRWLSDPVPRTLSNDRFTERMM